MKVGDLVKYIADPSSLFKWEKYRDVQMRQQPGVILERVESIASHTPRFKIRWHTGAVTEEWKTYLESCTDETG